MTLSLVESEEFKDFIRILDPRAASTLSTRNTLKNWVLHYDSEIRKRMGTKIQKAKGALTLCADIWSQQGLTYSYLGVMLLVFL